jgi:nitroreductase
MNTFLDLASTRRSIRKYEDREIPDEDIKYFIKAAVCAPSGCNSQCWKFVAIRDKATVDSIAQAVIKSMEEILIVKKDQLTEQYLASKRKMASFFVNAPLVIAVFMTHLEYYDPVVIDALEEQGYDYEGIMKLFARPDILSIGAAVQNLLLAVHEKGYGACWMNEPAIAGKDINKILNVPPECKFISLIPVGYPAYTPKNKDLKDMGEVLTII